MKPPVRHGLYALTDPGLIPGKRLIEAVAEAIEGGAVMVQYRDKGVDLPRRRLEAEALAELCRQREVPFIVNDTPELALEVGADGVHLGRDDLSPLHARQMLGADSIIGVSCYDSLELAVAAQQAGADYVAFGSFFPSPTKPHAVRPSPGLLCEASERLTLPVVAIGGITAENGGPLVEAGADLLAVITGVFGAADVRTAAAGFAGLF